MERIDVLPIDFCIPMPIDLEVGPNWGELRPFESLEGVPIAVS